MVNIVTVDNTRYSVDVGFGSHQPMQPVPLLDKHTFVQIAPRRGRLEHRSISQHSEPSQRVWVYSTQEDASAPWVERNLIVETEFFRADYEAMNMSTMSAKTSFFVQNVMAMRAILNEETGVVDGIYTLFGNKVKRHMSNDDPQLVAELRTDEDRVRAIRDYFGVRLSDLEQRGIRGLPTELVDRRTE
jgi:arylamine N-acetyltransferase